MLSQHHVDLVTEGVAYNKICSNNFSLGNVKWGDEKSASFLISNGVKQGGVISSLLFSLYVNELFLLLKKSGLGCHVGSTYAGAFG